MSLILVVLTTSGIIMSADSRLTYRNNAGMVRIATDTAMKIYPLTSAAAVGFSGDAFINDPVTSKQISIGSFIERFKTSELKDGSLTTKDIAQRFNDFFFDEKELIHTIQLKGGTNFVLNSRTGRVRAYSFTNKDGKQVEQVRILPDVTAIVAGIDNDRIGRAYYVTVGNGITVEKDTEQCGAMWIGQTEVVVRIIKGYDLQAPSLVTQNVPTYIFFPTGFPMSASYIIAPVPPSLEYNLVQTQLGKLEYTINWDKITLQDAIDFCLLITRTTENIQRFSDGTALSPGSGITGVGGDINVASLTSDHGFVWLRKSNLTIDSTKVDLDAHH